MRRFFILYSSIIAIATLSLNAQEGVYERAYAHTDKTCYVAGEEVWVKLYVTDNHFRPSSLSKVGYIEITDTEHPVVQTKLVLDKGSGSGRLRIPAGTPSGNYQLTAYTRYMRNEGASVFFRKQIAVINTFQTSPNDRVELTEEMPQPPASPISTAQRVQLKADRSSYARRMPVSVTIDGCPADVTDLTLSVVCNDSLTDTQPTNTANWRKQVTTPPTQFSGKFIPEYEGHIVQGRFKAVGDEPLTNQRLQMLSSSIAFVGKDIRYAQGQTDSVGNISYYTGSIYGTHDLVTSTESDENNNFQATVISPFSETLPNALPPLSLYPNKAWLEKRSIGVQLQQVFKADSLTGELQPVDLSCYHLRPQLSYDLNEYTRFDTMEETIIEFVRRIIVRKTDGKPRLRVLKEGEKRFNQGSTLVMLDGVPLYDHEDILSYNPRLVRKIDIYSGRYVFGGATFECMVFFTTHKGNLPDIQLHGNSQMTVYECPTLPVAFTAPEYKDEAARQSRIADYRHTLYWNPSVEKGAEKPATLTFYTSDLSGEYKVIAEGFTATGEILRGETSFRVE